MNKVNAKIRIADLDGLSDSIVRIYKADSAVQTDAFLKGAFSELEALSAQITTAILQDKTVSRLDEADSARDEALRSLGAVIAGYASFPIAEKKAAGTFLKAIYDKYIKAGIIKASYNAESSMIESLLEDFSGSESLENIEKLDGIEALLANIRSAQDCFAAANDEYVKSASSKGASATSLKKPLLSVINDKIVPYLNLMQANETLAEFSKSIEKEISRVNDSLQKRAKASK